MLYYVVEILEVQNKEENIRCKQGLQSRTFSSNLNDPPSLMKQGGRVGSDCRWNEVGGVRRGGAANLQSSSELADTEHEPLNTEKGGSF